MRSPALAPVGKRDGIRPGRTRKTPRLDAVFQRIRAVRRVRALHARPGPRLRCRPVRGQQLKASEAASGAATSSSRSCSRMPISRPGMRRAGMQHGARGISSGDQIRSARCVSYLREFSKEPPGQRQWRPRRRVPRAGQAVPGCGESPHGRIRLQPLRTWPPVLTAAPVRSALRRFRASAEVRSPSPALRIIHVTMMNSPDLGQDGVPGPLQ